MPLDPPTLKVVTYICRYQALSGTLKPDLIVGEVPRTMYGVMVGLTLKYSKCGFGTLAQEAQGISAQGYRVEVYTASSPRSRSMLQNRVEAMTVDALRLHSLKPCVEGKIQ